MLTERNVNRESPRIIHLAQALSKGERMEFVIQKAVELGVTAITPLITARSVVKLDKERMEKKLAQWQAIAVSACEQSGRNKIPVITPTLSLDNYLQNEQASLKFILYPEAAKTWRDYNFAKADIALLIGPEGGFSQEEVEHIFL
ncbi:RsmE family RNA methyltransferase [Legionella tunisiensis]|uniref:RsmE family RNA methyltransferase n=1 Tax=Legionella tunisiensis TaxID=1034944 RepID=UPI002FBEC7E6